MKKVLYLSNIESPYRVRFFNELAKHCDLTVVYERQKSGSRNHEWAKSEIGNYKLKFLNGIQIGDENGFSFRILRELFAGYDHIIVGCYNSPVQMMAILVMRLCHIPYILNLDGEPFLDGTGLKNRLKLLFLQGAVKYVVAGEKSANSLKKRIKRKEILPYYFSSLSEEEIEFNANSIQSEHDDTVLVVAQYLDEKGVDVALEAARLDSNLCFKFVGMGAKTNQFMKDYEGKIPANVEIVPFLQKPELEEEYRHCGLLVLPSRQECWGLVINEAASFGMPIVSTWGSGAAVEFLADDYPQYLAKSGDAEDLLRCIHLYLQSEDKDAYRQFLLEKTKNYSIERSVREHLKALR